MEIANVDLKLSIKF